MLYRRGVCYQPSQNSSYIESLLQDQETKCPTKDTETNKHRELGKVRRQSNMFQIKEQDKISEKELNKQEISNLPNKVSR